MANVDIVRRTRVFVRYYSEQGFFKTLRWVYRKLRGKATKFLGSEKSDILRHLDFVSLPAAQGMQLPSDVSKTTLNWFIPPFGRGSGGHLNIFRFIANLEDLGFVCNIVIVANQEELDDADSLKANIARWFVPLKARVFRGLDNAPPAYMTLATEWRTAYYVRSFEKTKIRCYFVQDFEPWFFPVGSEFCLAEETYRFGFVGITAGGWLKDKLAKEYGMNTYSVGFSYDRDLYKPLPKSSSSDKPKRVFFYARPPTPRRAFELGVLALKQVASRIDDVEIVLAGWDLSGFELPFKYKDLGILSVDALPAVYNSCDLALVLSLTNLSLLPLELMACGVPIVSNDGANNEWLLNSNNSKLTNLTPDGIAKAICDVLTDAAESQRLIQAGLETAGKTSWQAEAQKLAGILQDLAKN